MIPDVIAIVFLLVPWACMVYIFRGISSDTNPIWGNILAAGISFIVCAMVAIWFYSGTIVSPSIVNNASYQISGNLTVGDMLSQQASASNTTTKLGVGGSGMFIRSSISASSGNITNNTVINVHTYDIIYQQYQDLGLMFLYLLLGLISVALFLYFIQDMRHALREQDDYDSNDFGG